MMKTSLGIYTEAANCHIGQALQKIDMNKHGFLILLNEDEEVEATLTDGDIRRALLSGMGKEDRALLAATKDFHWIDIHDDFKKVAEYFKKEEINFLPILDQGKLKNIITEKQFQVFLLQDLHADLSFDFMGLDESALETEVYIRPWGFYKTTVLNDYYQAKVLSIAPGKRLSLQSHKYREEHWVIVHGKGLVQLDDTKKEVRTGDVIYIPQGCRHRMTNSDLKENLVISEIQLGNYLGEDDIIRYEDDYGRGTVTR